MTEQPPTDDQIRAYLDRNPTAFRQLLDRATRTDPAWWDHLRRREARIQGRPYP